MPKKTSIKLKQVDLPQWVDRKTGAALVTLHFFPVAARSLEVWPVAWVRVNGRAVCETRELFEVAKARLDVALALSSTGRSVRNTASSHGDTT